MFLHFKSMKFPMFPSKDVVKMFKGFKNVRCSINYTDFFLRNPRDYARQGNVYSSYKHHTTMKALIAVTSTGAAVSVQTCTRGMPVMLIFLGAVVFCSASNQEMFCLLTKDSRFGMYFCRVKLQSKSQHSWEREANSQQKRKWAQGEWPRHEFMWNASIKD